MEERTKIIDVYLEMGKKKTFAGAVDWPGWSRSGRDEPSALQALCDYGERYAGVLRSIRLDFQIPTDVSVFNVIERLEGDATTDFGAPNMPPTSDNASVDETQLQRFLAILDACWVAFDQAVRFAEGKELKKGPRGGGRDLEKICHHVINAEAAYLRRIGYTLKQAEGANLEEQLGRTRQAVPEALAAAAHGGVPDPGPRGGKRWTARYYVRRSAWHVIDHAWEIEDRIGG